MRRVGVLLRRSPEAVRDGSAEAVHFGNAIWNREGSVVGVGDGVVLTPKLSLQFV